MHQDTPMPLIWFPGWLHRLLPLIYVIGGALMFYLFGDQAIGLISGILLFAAALLIWALRLYASVEASRQKP
jgi:hypothetical protein